LNVLTEPFNFAPMIDNPDHAKPPENPVVIHLVHSTIRVEKRSITLFAFLLVIILFFSNYCEYHVENPGRTGIISIEKVEKSLTGLNLLAGIVIRKESHGIETMRDSEEQEDIAVKRVATMRFNYTALMVIVSAALGVITQIKKPAHEALWGTILAFTGTIGLLLLLLFLKKYDTAPGHLRTSVQTKIVIQYAYWTSLLSFLAAGSSSFLRMQANLAISPCRGVKSKAGIQIKISTEFLDKGVSQTESLAPVQPKD
jgi:hypothetical protein